MAEATTSAPKQETTLGGGEAITSAKPTGEPATPDKKVVELEGEVERLRKELENQKTLQSQADKKARIAEIERKKLDAQLKRIREGEGYIPPSSEGETSVEKEVRLNARIGIQNLILSNPDYQELLKQDITLREVMMNNPFAIIGEFYDAEDAVSQIREKLDTRVSSLAPQPPAKGGEKGGAEFEVGPIQPKSEPPLPPKPAQTGAGLQESVEQSIKSKIKFE